MLPPVSNFISQPIPLNGTPNNQSASNLENQDPVFTLNSKSLLKYYIQIFFYEIFLFMLTTTTYLQCILMQVWFGFSLKSWLLLILAFESFMSILVIIIVFFYQKDKTKTRKYNPVNILKKLYNSLVIKSFGRLFTIIYMVLASSLNFYQTPGTIFILLGFSLSTFTMNTKKIHVRSYNSHIQEGDTINIIRVTTGAFKLYLYLQLVYITLKIDQIIKIENKDIFLPYWIIFLVLIGLSLSVAILSIFQGFHILWSRKTIIKCKFTYL